MWIIWPLIGINNISEEIILINHIGFNIFIKEINMNNVDNLAINRN